MVRKRSQVDRKGELTGKLTENSVIELLERITIQLPPDDPDAILENKKNSLLVRKLLTSEVRTHFDHLQKNAVATLDNEKLYETAK